MTCFLIPEEWRGTGGGRRLGEKGVGDVGEVGEKGVGDVGEVGVERMGSRKNRGKLHNIVRYFTIKKVQGRS